MCFQWHLCYTRTFYTLADWQWIVPFRGFDSEAMGISLLRGSAVRPRDLNTLFVSEAQGISLLRCSAVRPRGSYYFGVRQWGPGDLITSVFGSEAQGISLLRCSAVRLRGSHYFGVRQWFPAYCGWLPPLHWIWESFRTINLQNTLFRDQAWETAERGRHYAYVAASYSSPHYWSWFIQVHCTLFLTRIPIAWAPHNLILSTFTRNFLLAQALRNSFTGAATESQLYTRRQNHSYIHAATESQLHRCGDRITATQTRRQKHSYTDAATESQLHRHGGRITATQSRRQNHSCTAFPRTLPPLQKSWFIAKFSSFTSISYNPLPNTLSCYSHCLSFYWTWYILH